MYRHLVFNADFGSKNTNKVSDFLHWQYKIIPPPIWLRSVYGHECHRLSWPTVHGRSWALCFCSDCLAFLAGSMVLVTPTRFLDCCMSGGTSTAGSLRGCLSVSSFNVWYCNGWKPRSWLNLQPLPLLHAPRLNLKHSGRVDVWSSVIFTCFSNLARSAFSLSANRLPKICTACHKQ